MFQNKLNTTRHLIARELRALWRTRWFAPIGTLTVASHSVLVMTLALGTSPRSSAAIIEDFFYVSFGVSMALSILLSMRTFAEDYAQHTWLVLASSPVPSSLIVLAKWASCLMSCLMITLCTLPCALLIAYAGELTAGHLVAGYAGLVLVQAASLAVGVAASTLGPRQLLASALTAATLLLLTSTWLLAAIAPPPLDMLLLQMSFFDGNFKGFMAGRVTLSEVVYYLGITGVALLAATQRIISRRQA